jgi:outer membrane protein TolC
MKIKILITLIFAFLVLKLNAQEIEKQNLTLDKCIQFALKNNPGIQADYMETNISDKLVSIQKGKLLPNVSLSSEYMFTDQYSNLDDYQSANASLQVYYPIWQNGKIRTEIKQAKAGREVVNANYKIDQSNLVYQVIEAYTNYQRLNKLSMLANNMVNRLAITVDAANERFNIGLSKKSDLLKAQTEYSNAVYMAIQIETSKKRSLQTLLKTSGLPLDTAITLNDTLVDQQIWLEVISQDSLNQIADQYLPEFQLINKRIEQQGFSEQIERKKMYPEIGAFGSYNYLRTPVFDSDFYGNVGLTLKMELFTGWRKKNQVAIEKIKSEQLGYEELETNRLVYSEIRLAWLSLSEAREKINNAKIQVASADESYQTINQQYLNGISSMLELIDAQYADFNANQNYVNALADYYLSIALLKRKTGLLNYEYCK